MHSILRNTLEPLRVHADRPRLMEAQLEALSGQLPLLYFLLAANASVLAFTHFATAPLLLSLGVPGVLVVICVVRGLKWRRVGLKTLDAKSNARQLRALRALSVVLSLTFAGWAISLLPYGDAYQQGHVAFFMSVTVTGVIICLVHFPPAALLILFVVVTTFVFYFGLSGNPVFAAIAFNFALVSVAIKRTVTTYFTTFSGIVDARKSLEDQRDELAILSERNKRLAERDPLTGLANRRAYFQVLGDALLSVACDGPFSVGAIDLDGFKSVNDLFGHSAGDQLLVQASARLESVLGPSAKLARLGGDEFGIIVYGTDKVDDLLKLGRVACEALATPFILATGTAQVSGSIGFAVYAGHEDTPESLFDQADFALYKAKEAEGGRTEVFTHEHAEVLRRNGAIEQALRFPGLSKQISLAFQPVHNISSQEVEGFEALIRWQHPVLGSISPSAFLPIAERMGLIRELTRLVVQRALHEAVTWPAQLQVSINLSAVDLVSAETALILISEIEQTGIAAGRVRFEITETALLKDLDRASATVDALRGFGCQVVLDDFGTGFSSLSHLQALDFDCIKIDRRFVADVDKNPKSQRLVRTMLELCSSMQIEAVVEGVETAAQLEVVCRLGARKVQGFLFAKPMQGEEVAAYLDQVAKTSQTLLKQTGLHLLAGSSAA